MESFLFSASIYLGAAVLAVPVATRLGLGSVLGYLAAGILIGPVLGLVGAETKEIQHFAEFGVVMMLFLIGLELEPRALWDMRHRLLGLGGLQITLTTLAFMVGGMAFGLGWSVALAVGLIFALSSTAIVLQTLSEKGLMRTGGGRATFSVLLTQDIAVIPILALLPLLALPKVLTLNADGSIDRHLGDDHSAAHGSLSLVADLPGWGVTLVTMGAIGAIFFAGIFLARPVFRFIHAAHLREMFTALALLIVVGISFLMMLVGLSPALGAFLAGVVLANSEFRHELETDIEPFKGLLLGLFFITVGAGINFAVLMHDPSSIILLTIAVILIKAFVLFALSYIFKIRGTDRWLFTLGLAQAGEFGFVLTAFSVAQNVIPIALSERILLIIALSMLVTPLFFILMDIISKRLPAAAQDMQADEIDEDGPVIIAGVGRFGQIVNRLVGSVGFKTVVIDHDMDTIDLMRRFGFKGFFGDPTRPDMLRAAGLAQARVLVVALDDPEATLKLVTHARKERPDLHIIARAQDRSTVFRLYQAGANDIVREMFDSSLRAGRYVLENIGLSEFEAAEAEKAFFHHDRHAVRELARVWNPDISSGDNAAYIARAKE
ncbi:cation:proton antiporter, partial [Planktotalea sp.]|uniref:cation:proton antiporter domain-containing protein n=1 Tax=Planktotalea sp. TaxID=2029877 RepID=UPI0032972FD8